MTPISRLMGLHTYYLALGHAIPSLSSFGTTFLISRSSRNIVTRNRPRIPLTQQGYFTAPTSATTAKMPGNSGKKEKVAVIGSGNWGSAIARIAGINTKRYPDQYEEEVVMWVREEQVDGRPLTEIINEKHENVKYLTGINIGSNIRAEPDMAKAMEGATALIIVIPHQFLKPTLEQMKGKVAPGARICTLIKGVHVEGSEIKTFPSMIAGALKIPCSALSGANIANEVAQDKFSESTLGIPPDEAGKGKHLDDWPEAKLWKPLFQTPTFRIEVVDDVDGVSICGALKNIVAMAAGFVDGLGWGDNSKAAIMRIGIVEIHDFCLEFFPQTKSSTFLQESCGIADVMTSCMGGRNRKVAEAMVQKKKGFRELEQELLNGQKLQGAETAADVHNFLVAHGVGEAERNKKYPLFENVWKICFQGMAPEKIIENI
ncbi:glycerol-3-phosphate dehydrogenase [Tulasnella sp. JGI-2019a]|nr:glycerol-3-phosphate dehydrogenase [Tulasnella sp. JGI-2019a]KAG9024286.1 glycerol-3-phosphate dehydrogenase [Tulasnella sp. JGI-2019a]